MLSRFEALFDQDILHQKISGKKILICGSGPSLSRINFNALDYDYILTCNHFFNFSVLANSNKILFISFQPIIGKHFNKVSNYLENHPDVFVGSEENSAPFFKSSAFVNFKQKYSSRYCNYWTQDHVNGCHCIGVAGRLCYFALHFNPSVLYFAGVDGRSKDFSKDPINSFRPEVNQADWKTISGRCKDYNTVLANYLKMSEIIFNKSKAINCKIYNLGEGLDYNMASNHSSTHFPLTEDIKSKLNYE